MYYTYVLLSEADRRLYIGATQDLRRRPLQLVYHEACLSPDDAYRRERYLKSGRGGRYLKQRLACTLSSTRDNKLERH